MTVVKLFSFSELPKYASEHIFRQALSMMGDCPLDYGAYKYIIGYFSSEYERSIESDGEKWANENYDLTEVKFDKKLAEWFYKKGCSKGEKVYLARKISV